MNLIKPITAAASLSFLAFSAFAGPTASDLDCLECVQAQELEAGAVGARELADDAVFVRTILIRSDGTPTENCNALLTALVETSGADADNPSLIKLEPGIYDCEFPEVVEMNPFVDIEGSGQTTTVIQGYNLPVIRVAANSQLRQLTVVALGLSRGVEMQGTNASVSHVTVEARHSETSIIPTGISIGPPNVNPSTIPIEVTLEHVKVRAGLTSVGPLRRPGLIVGTAFQIGGPSNVRMTDVDAHGARNGLSIVAANVAKVVATASKFTGSNASVRVETSNTAAIVASQLLGPIGLGLGTLHCIASYGSSFDVLDSACQMLP